MKGLFLSFLFLLTTQIVSSQIEDSLYRHHPSINLSFSSSNLPIVVINLDEKMKNKDEDTRIPAKMRIIWNQSGKRNNYPDTTETGKPASPEALNYNGKIEIKYRGNTSYYNSRKKPFAIKTIDENGKKLNAPILGMGADSDWALLAPYGDKSLMRDVLFFDLMKNGNMEYVPTGRYCEVVLNGIYQGIYVMAARVRPGENRINIPKPGNLGDELTGGYQLEIDRNDGDDGFFSKQYNTDLYGNNITKTYYQHKSPDGDDYAKGNMNAQREYIENLIHEFESVMASEKFNDPKTGYTKYLNVESVIDYIIAQEFSRNTDAYRLSTPMYKKRDSVDPRFHMSIWDLNISSGNSDIYGGWSPQGWMHNFNLIPNQSVCVPFWFKKLLKDTAFNTLLKKRWVEARKTIISNNAINSKIDSIASLLMEGQERNFKVWPILGVQIWPNVYWGSTWEKEVNYLKNFILQRVSWIDSQWGTAAPENLLSNGDFEEDLLTGELSAWQRNNGNCGHSDNAYSGKKSMSFRGEVTLWQTLTEIKTGSYTLEFWTRTEGTPNGEVYLRNENGDLLFIGGIENYLDNYSKIVIDDIGLTDGNWDIVFKTSGLRMHLDNVKFYESKNATGIESTSKDFSHSLKIKTTNETVTFDIDAVSEETIGIEIFTTSGIKVYKKNNIQLNTGSNSISCLLKQKGIYVYKITNRRQITSGKFAIR